MPHNLSVVYALWVTVLGVACSRPNPRYDREEPLDAARLDATRAQDAGGLDCCEPWSAPAFKVGSFLRGSEIQTIAHGLGTVPKALILWTADKSAGAATPDYRFAIGISDGPNSSRSVSAASQSGSNMGNSCRRMALKALTIIQWGMILVSEADLMAWDATQFTLKWSGPAAPANVVHYAVLGGTEVRAKIIQWQTPIAPGAKVVTGFGFKPSAILNLYVGAFTETPPPANTIDGDIGWGVADGAGGQWANHVVSRMGLTPTISRRGQSTNGCIYVLGVGDTPNKRASLVSMDADGFTLAFSDSIDQAGHIFTLGLAGLAAKAGTLDKVTGAAPATQSILEAGFRPGLVLFSSVQNVAQTVIPPGSRYVVGASDGTTQGSAALSDATATAISASAAIDRTNRAFVKMNNDQGVVEAECSVTALTAEGATLSWSPNDAVATEVTYLMLGAQP